MPGVGADGRVDEASVVGGSFGRLRTNGRVRPLWVPAFAGMTSGGAGIRRRAGPGNSVRFPLSRDGPSTGSG